VANATQSHLMPGADDSDRRGYGEIMAPAQSGPREAHSDDTDVTNVVRALHRWGPQSLRELVGDPEFANWPAQRLEHAVVSAWSLNLIFIDARDLLVAL
jgi:hypothetical protein